MLTLSKIYHAENVLKSIIRPTDLVHAPNMMGGTNIYLKPENLQLTGSFKLRGAYYKISQLSDQQRKKGVVACSAGNHAQGVALAATKNDIASVICLPEGAPISKVEATKRYGAEVQLVCGSYDDAYLHALALREQSELVFIHPFDDFDVIAGQGTIGLELLNQLPNVDAVIVPVGGGGLISGIAYTVKQSHPNVKIYGVQASGAPAMADSFHDGAISGIRHAATIADGIAVKKPGIHTFALCQKYVDDIVTVTDDEISSAILMLMEQQKLIAEGAGAVAVAAAMFGKLPITGKNVICIISGGNIDVTILSRVVTRGLLQAGRSSHLTIALPDKPGQLQAVLKIIASTGGNVVTVHHDRADLNMDINACFLHIVMETRDHIHVTHIKTALSRAGFELIDK